MNKNIFLKKLESKINSLPKEYIKDIISDYSDHFEDGLLDGKTESEIIKELGSLDYIANSILSEYYIENPKKVSDLNTFMKALRSLNTIGIGTLSLLIGAPIVLSFLLCYLSFYLLSFSFIVMPLALIVNLVLPDLPISFGTDIFWQKILITGVLFMIGVNIFNLLEKARKKAFSFIFKILTKKIKSKSFRFKDNALN